MKKIPFGAVAGLFSIFIGAGVILAHAPFVNITAIGGQDATSGNVNISVATLPTTVDVTGTVTHENPGNVNPVKLDLTDNGVSFYSSTNYFAGSGNVGTENFTIPWTVNSAGSHIIVITASHGNQDGTDTVDATVTLNIIVNQCPAAPSIAAHYLKDILGVKAGSKLYQNVVSLVAKQMGPTTDFNGVSACDADYATTVEAFVILNQSILK